MSPALTHPGWGLFWWMESFMGGWECFVVPVVVLVLFGVFGRGNRRDGGGVVCPRCGAVQRAGARFCHRCGQRL